MLVYSMVTALLSCFCILKCLCSHGQLCCCMWLLPAPSVYMELPLIIINKYDDIFLYPCWGPIKQEGKEREGGRKRKTKTKNCSLPVVCILFMLVTYSTDPDSKTEVDCLSDVRVSGSFSGLFCWELSNALNIVESMNKHGEGAFYSFSPGHSITLSFNQANIYLCPLWVGHTAFISIHKIIWN